MYIPKYFKVENADEILDFVQKLFWHDCYDRTREANRDSFAFRAQ